MKNLPENIPSRVAGPAPERFKHVIIADYFRRLTFLERLRIFFGYNLLVLVRVPCRHNPAVTEPWIRVHTSEHTEPEAHMVKEIEDLMKQKCIIAPPAP